MSALAGWKGLVRMIPFPKNEDRAELFTRGMDFRKYFFSHSIFFPGSFYYVIKKWKLKRLRPPSIITFKTDIIKVVSVFSISNFFKNRNSQGRKLSAV